MHTGKQFMPIHSWSVGVTTAPRQKPTLERMLDSLKRAGWINPRLFVEPDTELPSNAVGLPVSQRDSELGAFPNWYLGLCELVMRDPRVDAYFLCQDDVVFCHGLRGYLERALWPAERTGIVSAYCASHVSAGKPLGFQADDRGWDTWGALALVFPNESARAFLTHPSVLQHRVEGPGDGLRNIDSVVGAWCQAVEMPYYIHVPSFAQHIGETSVIYPGGGVAGKRQAANFAV